MAEKSQHELALELAALARQADKIRGEFEERLIERSVSSVQGVFASVAVGQLQSTVVFAEIDGVRALARAGVAAVRLA